MGAWGTAIFSNDTSADVRDDFKRHLQDGASAKDATEKILDDFAARDTTNPDNNDVWFGLASTQHSTGHVVPHVLITALELIESPEEMERWDQSLHKRRASALRQLKEKLQTEPPPPATFKARKKLTTDLIPGHISSTPSANHNCFFGSFLSTRTTMASLPSIRCSTGMGLRPPSRRPHRSHHYRETEKTARTSSSAQ